MPEQNSTKAGSRPALCMSIDMLPSQERKRTWYLEPGTWYGFLGAFFRRLFTDLDVQPLDLLVERRERDAEALGCLGLVPLHLLEHVGDDASLALLDDLEQGRIGGIFEQV